MTNEEFERTKEFILEQQAQFTAGMQELRQAQAQTDRAVAQTESVLVETGEIVARLQKGTGESFTDVKAKINTLIDSQIRTEDDWRKVIAFRDRYLGRRRNRN